MTLGAMASAAGAGAITPFMGRKGSVWTASVLCCVSNVTMISSTNICAIYVGRALIGLANVVVGHWIDLHLEVVLLS